MHVNHSWNAVASLMPLLLRGAKIPIESRDLAESRRTRPSELPYPPGHDIDSARRLSGNVTLPSAFSIQPATARALLLPQRLIQLAGTDDAAKDSAGKRQQKIGGFSSKDSPEEFADESRQHVPDRRSVAVRDGDQGRGPRREKGSYGRDQYVRP